MPIGSRLPSISPNLFAIRSPMGTRAAGEERMRGILQCLGFLHHFDSHAADRA